MIRLLLALCLLALPLAGAPTFAHENHNRAREAQQRDGAGAISDHAANPAASSHMDKLAERPTNLGGRLVSFMGRMHPFAVHFPIALFPIAWVALIFARRRGERAGLIRALIVVAGAGAAIAGLLGWLNAGTEFVDRDPIQLAHRWIGTALAAFGAALALLAWRRADAVNGRAMAWAMGGMTAALIVQGWFGAALTHGVDHMMF